MKQKVLFWAGSVLLALGVVLFFCVQDVYAAGAGTVNYYHKHTGNSQSGGGCYGKQCSGTRECGSYNLSSWENANGTYNYRCGQCGNEWTYTGYLSGARCQRMVSYQYYECNCGVGSSAVAALSCSYPKEGWTRELELTGQYEILHESCRVAEKPYIWNGTASDCPNYHVTQNGTYTLGLATDENTDTSQVISVTVDWIDANAPVIESFGAQNEGYSRETTLVVSATDSESGLSEQPYSYDGGQTWTDQSTFVVNQNGTYTVLVRDCVGNRSSAQTEITVIDRTEPTVTIVTSPRLEEWYEGEMVVTVQAADDVSGLAEYPISFDGGASFGNEHIYRITGSTELAIVVADKAGNHKNVVVTANKKVRPTEPPKAVKPTQEPAAVTCTPTVTLAPEVFEESSGTTQGQQQLPVDTMQGEMTQNETVTGEVPKSVSGENRRERPWQKEERLETEEEQEEGIKEQHYPGLHYPEVHYPEETWQGTPMKGRDTEKENDLKTAIQQEEFRTEQGTVVLNDLLEQPENRETHTVTQEEKQHSEGYLQGFAVLLFLGVAIICVSIVFMGKYVVFVSAKDKNGKYRMVGITRIRGGQPVPKVIISDTMLKRAQTNGFAIKMPWWCRAKARNEKVIVSCHHVEREIPMQGVLYIRLRSE